MRRIRKNQEPRSLTQYRNQGNEYDGPNFTSVKHEIKLSLLAEQGHLCAYCMDRISVDKMKVEHWACQERNKTRQLDYSNLLGCCMGNQEKGNSPQQHTCDTKKANHDLKYNPSDPDNDIERLITYQGNGQISSTDAEFNQQINSVLNLNYFRLIENRAAILRSVRLQLGKKAGDRTKQELSSLLEKIQGVSPDMKLQPYCAVAVSYLRSKIG